MIQKKIIAWGFILLLVFSALPLAFAQSQALTLNTYWNGEVVQKVVEQGQFAEFSVSIISQSQSRLSVNILRSGRIVQRIRNGQIIPTGLNNPFYFTTVQIGTNNMAGDYVIEVIAANNQGSERETLALSVQRDEPVNNNNNFVDNGDSRDFSGEENNWQDSVHGESYNNPRFNPSSQVDLGINNKIIGFGQGIQVDRNDDAMVQPNANPDPRVVPNAGEIDFNVNDIVPLQGGLRGLIPSNNNPIDEGVGERIIPPEDEAVGTNPLNDQEPVYVPTIAGQDPVNDQEPQNDYFGEEEAGEDPVNDLENTAPVLTTPAVLHVEEGQTITFQVEVFDADGDSVKVIAHENCGEDLGCLFGRMVSLLLGLDYLPDNASYNDATRTFTYTPGFDTVELFGGQEDVEFQFIGYDGQDYSQWAMAHIIVHDRRHFNPQPIPPEFLPEDPVIPEVPEQPEQPEETGDRVGAVIASAHVSNMVMVGDTVQVSVNVDNNGDVDMEDLRVRVIIPDLGISASTSTFDLNAGMNKQKTLGLPIPVQARQGLYLIRIVIENGDFHETAHRYVTIVR
ncbi:MAG: hypothetical protein Q8Q01_03885 [archaeon]|nr:hypothetical protein [archaeon]